MLSFPGVFSVSRGEPVLTIGSKGYTGKESEKIFYGMGKVSTKVMADIWPSLPSSQGQL
jgi:hypothetical protein